MNCSISFLTTKVILHFRLESAKLCVLRAHVPACLACSRSNIFTCLRVNVSCVLTCQRALRAYLLRCHAYLLAQVLCVPKNSRAITANANNFSVMFYLDFWYFFFVFFLRNKTFI